MLEECIALFCGTASLPHILIRYYTVKDQAEGNFTNGNVVYNLENDGVGLAPFHDYDSIVPQSVKDAVATATADIIAGTIQIPTEVDDTLVN